MEKVHQKKKLLGCKIKTCDIHGEYKASPLSKFNNKTYWTCCPDCLEEQKIKDIERKTEADKAARLNKLKSSGIAKRFINSTFENYNKMVSRKSEFNFKTILQYHNRFKKISETGSSIVLCGTPGTGKTHLACALAISLIDQSYWVTYSTSYKMMSRIKNTYSKHSIESEQDVIKKLTSCDLLIIDEIGVQFGSEAEKVLFYQIINGRYDKVLPTILISNLTINELIQFIGERCFDRLKEGSGVVLSFDWESYRK